MVSTLAFLGIPSGFGTLTVRALLLLVLLVAMFVGAALAGVYLHRKESARRGSEFIDGEDASYGGGDWLREAMARDE